ncbi:MAG TPA: DNA-formamidopyrimidine glycosylase family protein, partial [Acidimicrobiales bacterium]|nr:DNA-formamidopyrimidine glycosylase family protein [Acidimicrobiales bacterium]
ERCAGRIVARLDLASISALKTFDPPLKSFVGRPFEACRRRGKYLCMRFDDRSGAAPEWLVIHLARAGWIKWRDKLPSGPVKVGRGPLVLRVGFEGGEGFDVTEMGHERRLATWTTRSPDDIEALATLGPEPLDPEFTEARFARILAAEKGDLKRCLSRQSVIAGVGNAYSDEALHAARLSPFKPAANLSAEEASRLYAALVGVLQAAIERAETLEMDELKDDKRAGMRVHARTGLACPVCGDTVREVSFATRSLQYCPTCQTGGRPLADRRLSRLLK